MSRPCVTCLADIYFDLNIKIKIDKKPIPQIALRKPFEGIGVQGCIIRMHYQNVPERFNIGDIESVTDDSMFDKQGSGVYRVLHDICQKKRKFLTMIYLII